MKHLTFLFLFSVCLSTAFAQKTEGSQKFLTETLNQPILTQEELLSDFVKFDFNSLWTKHDEYILGFIGDDYQRLHINYLAVIKNFESPSKYYVYGKSKVKSNICRFIGEIEILHVRKIDDPQKKRRYEAAKEYQDTDEVKRLSKEEYILLAKYQFYEDPDQKGTGIFKGIVKSNFYVEEDSIFYNDLDRGYSDRFSNNQHVGTWISYASGATKKANWGEFRIPYSGDLDWGAGEFSPNKKYLQNGWETYYEAYIKQDTAAQKEEEARWWD